MVTNRKDPNVFIFGVLVIMAPLCLVLISIVLIGSLAISAQLLGDEGHGTKEIVCLGEKRL